MKLLLDQNISRKLVKLLDDIFPESQHISTVLSENSEDGDIWSFAKENGYVIATKTMILNSEASCSDIRQS